MGQHDEVRARLETRLAELRDNVARIERDLRRPKNQDSEERAVESENDQVLERLDEKGIAEARDIEAALRRLEDGTYGECVGCGGAIGSKRLEAVLSATRCVKCAS